MSRLTSGTLGVILSGRMLVAFAMGFSSGMPLLLTGSVLQAWMTD
jgi:PAT family beta-lactamase induction signal transducer AmpG